MNYKRSVTLKPGYNEIAKPGDADLEMIGFGIVSLAAGETYSVGDDGKETALVILSGTGTISGDGFAYKDIGQRKNVFEGKPASVYFPAGNKFEIESKTDLEVAICQAPSDRDGRPLLISPENVKSVTIGKDNWTRDAYLIVDDDVPAHNLFIGEAIVPSGNWGSFPPHRHDKDDLPDEVDMEEIYFFRFDRPGGFGIQKIYTDDRTIDETLTVEENDTALLPEGYHPVVTAPGYSMYYLWIMAGAARKFISRQDPTHSWVAKS